MDTLGGRLVANCGGRIISMFVLAEEDVDSCSNWAGGQALRSEVRYGLTLDGVLLVVQGEDNMGDIFKPPDWGIRGEEGFPGEEDEIH